MEASLDAGLTPVLCIGETKEDHGDGKKEYRLKKQLMKALEGIDLQNSDLLIAYEPVWAVGTGDPCPPDLVVETLLWVKEEIRQYLDKEVPLLYGGSTTPDNVGSYLSSDVIDGILVGGASVKYESFVDMINNSMSL